MVSKKRVLEEPSSSRESKKPKKFDAASAEPSTLITADEIDFPRGGGTALTALEVKATRAEGVKEANAELFDVRFSNFELQARFLTYHRSGKGRQGKVRKEKEAENRRDVWWNRKEKRQDSH